MPSSSTNADLATPPAIDGKTCLQTLGDTYGRNWQSFEAAATAMGYTVSESPRPLSGECGLPWKYVDDGDVAAIVASVTGNASMPLVPGRFNDATKTRTP